MLPAARKSLKEVVAMTLRLQHLFSQLKKVFFTYGPYEHYILQLAPAPMRFPRSYPQTLSVDNDRLDGTGAMGTVEAIQTGYGPAVHVSVSSNGGLDWSTVADKGYNTTDGEYNPEGGSVLFEYHPAFLLGSLDPLSGPAIGGTVVTVSLAPTAAANVSQSSNFGNAGNSSDVVSTWQFSFDPVRDASANCLFNETVVAATVTSNLSVECVAPPTVPAGGVSFVRVSVNGAEVFDGSTEPVAGSNDITGDHDGGGTVQFFYLPDEEDMAVFPASGPVKGGTLVEVSSRHIATAAGALFLSQASNNDGSWTNTSYFPSLLPPSSVWCLFGDEPAVAASGVTFHWDGVVDADGRETGVGRIKCLSPPAENGLPSPVAVKVSLNGGKDFTLNGPQFHYRPEAYVYSVEPAYGPVTGGNPVRVEGGTYRDEDVGKGGTEQMVRCRFGDHEVGATVLTTGLISCRSPPMTSVPEQQDIEVQFLGGHFVCSPGADTARTGIFGGFSTSATVSTGSSYGIC